MDEIGAVILAGGKSNRMGKNKAFLPLGDKPLFEHVLKICTRLFKDIMVITKEPDPFLRYPVKVERDLVEAGALGGLYTGLFLSLTPFVFCVACDMPFLKEGLVKYLLSLRNGYDAVVPMGPDGLHPLCAVYSKSCLNPIEKSLSEGNKRISSFFKEVKLRLVEVDEVRVFDPHFLSFFNINTPSDLKRAEELLRGTQL
jgi:molybdopterin-guanine dinucleotide biosynthesis protein A